MDKNEYVAFGVLMATLGEVWDNEPKETKIEIYFRLLSKKLTMEQMQEGVERILYERTTASFPKPAEIIQAAIGGPETKTIRAIDRIERVLGLMSGKRSIDFEDPIANYIITNWRDGLSGLYAEWKQADNWHYVRKELERKYMAYIGVEDKLDAPYCRIKGGLHEPTKVSEVIKADLDSPNLDSPKVIGRIGAKN